MIKNGRWLLFVLAVVVLALDASVFTYVSWQGIQSNLTLVYAVVVGLVFGPTQGAVVGFWAGLLQDVYFGRFIGVHAVTHLMAAAASGMSGGRVFRAYIWLPVTVVLAATIIAESTALILFRLLGVDMSVLAGFTQVIVPGAILNAIIAPLIYGPIVHMRYHLDEAAERDHGGVGNGTA